MSNHKTQIAIVGGGICGLWLLNILRAAGYDTWLFEKDSLGCAQSLASQGMIHGGLKYALGGFTSPSSESIARMPETWQACLRGEGPPDLTGLNTLSDDYYLFSDGALSSKITTFFASRVLQARITALNPSDYPDVFQSTQFKGSLYRLQDMVLDSRMLLKALIASNTSSIFRSKPAVLTDSGQVTGLQLEAGQRVVAERYIFAAGAGNEALLKGTPLNYVTMQKRPLQQVMLRGRLPRIYAHAISLKSANKPRVTFTTHPVSENENVWYLGGTLAEDGVGKSPNELIDKARREIADLLPWINLEGTEWATLDIDRVEPAQENKSRPDHPFVAAKNNCLVCWPTKLTLTPMLGETVLEQINLAPAREFGSPPQLPAAPLGRTPWEVAFDQ